MHFKWSPRKCKMQVSLYMGKKVISKDYIILESKTMYSCR